MGDIDGAPTGAQDGAMRPDVSDAIRPRIEAVRELIGILVIAPQPDTAAEDLAPTVESLRALTERLGRLLAQAGMTDCVRAATSLENAVAGIPDGESFRNMDAALTYLRARLYEVALQPAAAMPPPDSQTGDYPRADADLAGTTNPAVSAYDDATAADIGVSIHEMSEVTLDEAGDEAGDDVWQDVGHAGAHSDDEPWDEDAFPTAAREAIRNFRSATLRQRRKSVV